MVAVGTTRTPSRRGFAARRPRNHVRAGCPPAPGRSAGRNGDTHRQECMHRTPKDTGSRVHSPRGDVQGASLSGDKSRSRSAVLLGVRLCARGVRVCPPPSPHSVLQVKKASRDTGLMYWHNTSPAKSSSPPKLTGTDASSQYANEGAQHTAFEQHPVVAISEVHAPCTSTKKSCIYGAVPLEGAAPPRLRHCCLKSSGCGCGT